MSNAEFERKIFWDMYNEILINNGEPFSISSKKQWAIVNKNSPAWNEPVIAMDFLVQKKVLRINAFLLDDEYLFAKLLGMKEEIEEALGFAPEWVHGEKGENTYRIKTELRFTPNNHDDYYRVIEKSLPIVMKYVETFRPYIKC